MDDPKNESSSKADDFIIYNQEEAFQHMTKRRSEKEQLLYMITDDVLFNVWDASCLSIGQEYREEYLPYLPQVFDLLVEAVTGLNLFNYLVFIEESQYGALKGDALTRTRASRVVELLIDYRDAIFNNTAPRFETAVNQQCDTSAPYPA